MIVTSAKYLSNGTDNIAIESVINSVTMIVPIDTANTHYQAIQEWIAKGNTIEEAD
tara:strand:+ start:1014 stop:1181 length:168 start_codon:yes stop_codon:yes gene_type:complete